MCFFFVQRLISSRRHIAELMISGFCRPMQLLRGEVNRFQNLAVHVRGDFSAYRQYGYKCGCCEAIVVKICSSSHNFYVNDVYWNLDLSDKIFDCLLMDMAKAQSEDRNESFLFVGNGNAHHREWLRSSKRDFALLSGCDQMVI